MASTTKTRKRTSSARTRKALTDEQKQELNEKRQAEASELHRQIALKVQTLAEGDEWISYLRFMKGFHTYSINNIMLMMAQRHMQGRTMPTLVAGFKAWQEKGRQVRKGEGGPNAMRIFGFSKKLIVDAEGKPVLDEKGQKRYRIFYPIVSVFDIDQTDQIDGVPEVDLQAHRPVLLIGDDELGLRDRVKAWLNSIDWAYVTDETGDECGTANGFTTADGSKRVVINGLRSEGQQAKTALHEMAHVILHVNGDGARHDDVKGVDRATRELEAESAAYVAGALLGLDTESYTDKYLLSWASRTEGTPGEAVKATAARVQKAVKKMVDVLEAQ